MPICIECRHPVKTLWTQYSGAGDPSSGHGIRLTVCKNCGRFCDKYVEHDFVVLFIDLVLIKPQVYRHLLHNTLMRERDQFDVRSIITCLEGHGLRWTVCWMIENTMLTSYGGLI